MKEYLISGLVIYSVIGIISVFFTIYDKAAAKQRRRRIPEKVLFFCAAVGGALPMLLTMKIINHKTRHKRFMLGLPAIILVQALIISVLVIVLS